MKYWMQVWIKFKEHKLGMIAFWFLVLFFLAGTYAPFLASGKPIVFVYDNVFYFPLFRYLFFQGYYTKSIDLFFNLLMFTLPLFFIVRGRGKWYVLLLQGLLFAFLSLFPVKDPSGGIQASSDVLTWEQERQALTAYQKVNLVADSIRNREQQERLLAFQPEYEKPIPTLWDAQKEKYERQIEHYKSVETPYAEGKGEYIRQRLQWLDEEEKKVQFRLMPLLQHFHWEEDAAGSQSFNRIIPFWDLTRINRKDFVSALLFGIRISFVVGFVSVLLALIFGIPIGAYAGFYGGKFDIVVSRLLEIWESMPTFFMLLLIVAILESKSIFLVIAVVGIFGWTGIARFVRGEFFKQRHLPYVEALRAQGFGDPYIMFQEILPNALPPVLTLLPFAIMGAITSEAGLSFLGLGDEGSCSFGVLMDEGRSSFPAESYLLWPPAIMLTLLLVAIALAGDAFRDTLDPRN